MQIISGLWELQIWVSKENLVAQYIQMIKKINSEFEHP